MLQLNISAVISWVFHKTSKNCSQRVFIKQHWCTTLSLVTFLLNILNHFVCLFWQFDAAVTLVINDRRTDHSAAEWDRERTCTCTKVAVQSRTHCRSVQAGRLWWRAGVLAFHVCFVKHVHNNTWVHICQHLVSTEPTNMTRMFCLLLWTKEIQTSHFGIGTLITPHWRLDLLTFIFVFFKVIIWVSDVDFTFPICLEWTK